MRSQHSVIQIAFIVSMLTLLPTIAIADITTTGVFASPVEAPVFTGIGTSNFAYGTGHGTTGVPTRVRFNGILEPGRLPPGRFTVGSITLSNGTIVSGTGATGVELLITATDTGPTEDQIIQFVIDGMVLHLDPDSLQQVELRAKSVAVSGACAVQGEFAGEGYGLLALPIIWSEWMPIGPGIVGGAWELWFRPVCDVGAWGEVRYFPELRGASGIAMLSFVNTPNTDDPIASADSFCMEFDGSTHCAWVKEGESSTFTLIGTLGSLEFVDLLPSPLDDGFVTVGTDPQTNIVIGVSIDVKPGNPNNVIDLEDEEEDKVTVAILTSSDSPEFDATAVDITTLRLGLASIAENPKYKDVDKDGDQDLRVKFLVENTGLECGATLVTLTGTTADGLHFAAADSITAKCGDDEEKDEDDELTATKGATLSE